MNKKETLMFIAIVITSALLIFCGAIVTGCSSNDANAQGLSKRDEIVLKYKVQKQDELLRAYNHLIHRIWIERPTYFEEVLTEGDEYYTLDSLLNGEWEDTFSFYNKEDSVAYSMNWDQEEDVIIKVIKHVVYE